MNFDVYGFLWIAAGVVVAVLFPIIRAIVTQEFPHLGAPGIPPWLRRYLVLAAFSLITALIALAGWKMNNPTGELTWYTAFLLGFGWEAAVEKVGRP